METFINQLELGDSSKESLYFIVSTYLKINDKHNSNIKTFQEAGYKLKKTREQKDGENELDDRELISYRPYNYFMNILNSINPSNTTNEKEHMKYLLLSILIKQPPVRTNFYRTAQFRTGGSYDEKQNYIFLHKIAGVKQVTLYIGHDKVSNTKSFHSIEKRNISVDNKELVNLIYDSYERNNRKYLIEINNKPISDHTLLKLLKQISGVDGMTIDLMRVIYITNFHENKRSFKARQELADKMRHTCFTANLRYNKVINNVSNDNEKDKRINELENTNNELLIKIKELQEEKEKLKQYETMFNKVEQRTYNKKQVDVDTNKEAGKEYKHLRSSMLFKLNSGVVKKPRQYNLDKYKIVYDEETKKYKYQD